MLKDEDTAYEFLKFCLFSIFDKIEDFKTLSNNKTDPYYYEFYWNARRDYSENVKIYFKLAETILLFKYQNFEVLMEKFKDLVTTVFDQNHLKSFLELVMLNNNEIFNSSPSILKLFEIRAKFLSEAVPIDFSWSMPGNIPGHPQLGAFLESENQEMTYRFKFNDLRHARNFGYKHEKFNEGYSLKLTPVVDGQNIHVVIRKTKDYYNYLLEKLNELYNIELLKIQRLLQDEDENSLLRSAGLL